LKEFLHPECWTCFKNFGCTDETKNNFAAKWAALDNAFVNFTHFVRQNEEPNGWSFTKFGIFYAWRRHAAYFVGEQLPCVDILIPIAYTSADNTITPDNMAYILISVKNHFEKNNHSICKDYLDEESILGAPNAEEPCLKPSNKSTLLLSLQKLTFILRQNEKNVPQSDNHSNNWIEVTGSNPYIAFVMSLDSGDMIGPQRFVPELQVSEACNRIDLLDRG
jgi:hypothetical protein